MTPAYAYAGGLAARSADAMRAVADADAQALWAVRGGSGSGRLLAAIEPHWGRSMRQRPRWLVGFSDITTLHARAQAAGIMSVHAANLTTLSTWTPAALQELHAMLTGASGPFVYCGQPLAEDAGRPDDVATGPLMGGNLTVLASLAGTGQLPSWRGAIVLLEDIDERPYRLDRCLGQLIDAGQLTGVAGIALGQLTRCEDPALGYSALQSLRATLAPLQVPLVAGLPIGHDNDSRAVMLGAHARIEPATGRMAVMA